jgi:predicted amidohydrolase
MGFANLIITLFVVAWAQANGSCQLSFERFSSTSLKDRIKVSAIQYPVEYGLSLEQVLAKVTRFAEKSKKEGAEVIVFPELFVLDVLPKGGSGTAAEKARLKKLVDEDQSQIVAHFQKLSRELQVPIQAGSFPRREGTEIRNTAHLFFPDGRELQQDKLFLTPWEKEFGWSPGNELKVFDTPWGRSAILICYDCQFAALSEKLAPYQPELIFVPSMTGDKGFHRVRWAAQARSVEHFAYVVVTGTTDSSVRGREYLGQAAFITPQDEGFPGILAEGKLNEAGVTTATFDLRKLREGRNATGIYSAKHAQERNAGQSIQVQECGFAPGALIPKCQ